jgi:uncharacterized metal-binding protein YceD (DUF177 family)
MIEVYDLRRLPDDGETIDEVLEKSWLMAEVCQDRELELTPLGDGHTRLFLQPIGDESDEGPVVRISGTLDARISTPCVRCLLDVVLDLKLKPDVTLFPALPNPAAAEAEGPKGRGSGKAKGKGKKKKDEDDDALPIDPAEPDAGTYTQNQIDLPALVREALLLEIPMNPACVDEGACAARTSQLIASVTPSDTESVDPRWAALQALKAKLS